MSVELVIEFMFSTHVGTNKKCRPFSEERVEFTRTISVNGTSLEHADKVTKSEQVKVLEKKERSLRCIEERSQNIKDYTVLLYIMFAGDTHVLMFASLCI